MHEWSIVRALLERVEAEARARRAGAVHRLRLRVGELSGVEVELLRLAFETFREGGRCAGAALDVDRVPARWRCPACGRRFRPGDPIQCTACARPAELEGGHELVLERIEMEVPDA